MLKLSIVLLLFSYSTKVKISREVKASLPTVHTVI